MTKRFDGQVVVITGAARGIGFAAARLFAEEGARVVINDLDIDGVKAAVGQIESAGGQAFGVACDVSDHVQVRNRVERVMVEMGRIDVLVNNAGIVPYCPAAELHPNDWNRVLAVNLSGTFYWCQAVAVASMIPRQKGAIVNVSSLAGISAIPNATGYVASKHGVVGLTKALAVEWGLHNIRVNALCPGLTWTDLTLGERAINPEPYKTRERRIPLGRAATAEDQARAILFLASGDANSVNGLIMNVDGGNMAMHSGYPAGRGEALGLSAGKRQSHH